MAPITLTPDSEDRMALSIANAIYGGGGFDAKLFRNLRETHGYTYGVYSSVSSDEISGSFSAGGDVNGNATDSSFVQMRFELQNMMDGDYTEDDLEKFKTMYAGDFSRSLESSHLMISVPWWPSTSIPTICTGSAWVILQCFPLWPSMTLTEWS